MQSMIDIPHKTLKDLEFSTVLNQVSDYCITQLGKEKVLEIKPYQDKKTLLLGLRLTDEYLSSFINNNRIPNHGFDTISKELKLLQIENTYLETSSLQKIVAISLTSNDLLKFFEKFDEYYPNLRLFTSHIEITSQLVNNIDEIVDRFGDVKDHASLLLSEIRRSINKIKGKINSSFTSALNNYHRLDYLDDKENLL